MPRTLLGIIVVCTVVLGCRDGATVAGGCRSDASCGEGEACVGGVCRPSCAPACEGDRPICGAGATCVECAADRDCEGGGPCDVNAGRCLVCEADGEGCSAPAPFCDVAAADGRGACVGCRSAFDCDEDRPVCDPERRRCVGCLSDDDCGGSAPACDRAAAGGLGACVPCLDSSHCGGATPVCDESVPGGACVTCLADGTGCGDPAPWCDVAAQACVGCRSADDCPAAEPICRDDTHRCVACTETLGCDVARPFCVVRDASGAVGCVQCRSDADCDAGPEECSHEGSCWNRASAAIAQALDPTAPLPAIYGATVTYLWPGDLDSGRGFYLQAERVGPAVFVEVDPASLAPPPEVGDRVAFAVTRRGTAKIRELGGWAVVSRGHPISPLVQDVNDDPNITAAPFAYEGELVSLGGRLDHPVPMNSYEAAFPIETDAFGPEPGFRLRVPRSLQDSLDLAADCRVTLHPVPLRQLTWFVVAAAFTRDDFASITCRPPYVLDARAVSPTEVRVEFTRVLDPATLLADGSQFTIWQDLAVTGLTFDNGAGHGTVVVLTTGPQTPWWTYKLFVASSVKDLLGRGVGMPWDVYFTGHHD